MHQAILDSGMAAEMPAGQPSSIVPLQENCLTPVSTRSLRPLPTGEEQEPPKTEDPVLLKEQQAIGMLGAEGSTRQRTTTGPEGYGVGYDNDEDDLSYRDPKADPACFTCVVL